MLWRVICLMAIFFCFVYARYFIVGPAKLKILSVDLCKEHTNYPMQLELQTRMFNDTTQLIDAFLGLPVDLDEEITINLKCSRIDKRKTQVNSFVLNDVEACSTMTKYVGDLWNYVQRQIGMKPGVCPIEKGNYSVKNMVLDLTKLNVQMILEGRFKTRVLLKDSAKPLYCADFTIDLSPKNK